VVQSKIPSSRPPVSGTIQSNLPRANRSAEDQPLHSFESGTDCRPERTRDSRRRRTRDNSAISAASGGCFGTIPLEFLRFLRWNPSSTRRLCTESILAFFGRGSQCEIQKAFRQQLREAAAIGRWESDWKAQVKYTVFLGSAEFVAQMRKLLRGDRDQQTGVRRGAHEALTWTRIVQAVSNVWDEPWEKLLSARGTGARQTALFIGRIRGRLSLKELRQLAGGIHHNAVGIAIRRFTQRLQSDRSLLEKVSLLQKELEPR
jgi:hypothetical protein